MGWIVLVAFIYLVIGFFKASSHVGSGRYGTTGPFATFATVMFFWPFI
jgi:hypothetical protein